MDELSGPTPVDAHQAMTSGATRSHETHPGTAANFQCLFYATGTLGDASESVVRRNRAANEWIASLRNHPSSLRYPVFVCPCRCLATLTPFRLPGHSMVAFPKVICFLG